jgi:hypothetical protein
MRYLIWSFEHEAWWKENGNGYTLNRSDAGEYDADEAEKIVIDANYTFLRGGEIPNEALIPIPQKNV